MRINRAVVAFAILLFSFCAFAAEPVRRVGVDVQHYY